MYHYQKWYFYALNSAQGFYRVQKWAQILWEVTRGDSCINLPLAACTDPESFVRGGPTFTTIFLVDEGKEDPNTTISGPSSARQRNAIEMAFRWRADDGPTLGAGLVYVALCCLGDPGQ